MNKAHDETVSISKHVPRSEAEGSISEWESSLSDIRFVPFSAYEKGMSGDGVAVLAKDGKTTGSQKIQIRSKPDNKSKVLAQKRVGTFLKAIGMEGDYYQVTVKKKTGYIYKDYIILLTDLSAEGNGETTD